MASEHVLEFTADNWQREVVQSDLPVVVDFWATWCGPCRALTPIIERVANQFAGKVKVGKLNIDDSPQLATEFGITSIPRIFIFKGGEQPKAKFVGLISENDLVKSINTVLESK